MGHLEVNPSRTPEPLFGRHVVGIRIMHAGELAPRDKEGFFFSLIPLSFRRFEASASVIRRADRPPLRDMQGATGVRRFLVDCMEDQKINQNSELTQHTVTAAPSIGAFVQLKNLHNQPELNGAVGNVIGAQTAGGRIPVEVLQRRVAIKPENLRCVHVDRARNVLSPDAPSLVERLGDAFDDIMPHIGHHLPPRVLGRLMHSSKVLHMHARELLCTYHAWGDTFSGIDVQDMPNLVAELNAFARALKSFRPAYYTEELGVVRHSFRPAYYAKEVEAVLGVGKESCTFKPMTTVVPEGVELFLLRLLDDPTSVGAPGHVELFAVRALCVDILNMLAGGSAPDVQDQQQWSRFGSWRGYARHVGGVPGRGSLTHLDHGGENMIFGLHSMFGGGESMRFEYSTHLEGAPMMRTRPKYSMMECEDSLEASYARFRYVLEEEVIPAVLGTEYNRPFAQHVPQDDPPGVSYYVIHPDDGLWLLFGRAERPTAHQLLLAHGTNARPWTEFFSRVRLSATAFRDSLERRYAQLVHGDPRATIPPPLAQPLAPAERAHVEHILGTMSGLPKDVWMCTVCACPTANYHGAGRYYCCYSCARRDEPAYLLERMLAEDGCLCQHVHAQLLEEQQGEIGQRSLHLRNLVEVIMGSFKPDGYPAEPREAFKSYALFQTMGCEGLLSSKHTNSMLNSNEHANLWKLYCKAQEYYVAQGMLAHKNDAAWGAA